MATGFVDATRVELHRGAIPVEVRLAQDEVADVSPPPPLFALIPRGAYLPCWHDGPHAIDDDDATTTRDDPREHTPREHFAPRLAPGRDASAPWFDHDGLPLRWNLPIGILHDLCAPGGDSQIPWTLTVHYRPFDDSVDSVEDADGTMFSCTSGDVARAHFFNALKEAVFVATGSAGGVMGLSRRAHADIWRSVASGDRSLASSAEDELGVGRDGCRRVPLRLYVRKGGGAMKGWGEVRFVSAPASRTAVHDDDDAPATLANALSDLGVGDVCRATVEGIDVGLGTELEELHGAMKGSDQFLHVCVWTR